ncbi:hypothetical protein O185_19795 [Photorhabdus temperata J3]|uniref:Uncharacterized protein n=1 Tax=Photorhabdus temperata J3 TaxID=1389415 RepID=U7QW44_PHOTE|nr:hypothetical protein O185_19795 [Photorhabdus temperata J3]
MGQIDPFFDFSKVSACKMLFDIKTSFLIIVDIVFTDIVFL